MIAMALSCNPTLLIADETTTALDVTTQAQIMQLMAELQQEFGMAMMLITHNLGVVAQMAKEVIVMYLGRAVEKGPKDEVFENPRHPYTAALLSATPRANPEGGKERIKLQGELPSPLAIPEGCPFAPRCWKVQDVCRKERPVLEGAPHPAACYFPVDE